MSSDQRFRDGFGHLLRDLPPPPMWEDLATTKLQPTPLRPRRGPRLAIAAALVTLLVIAPLLVLRALNRSDPAASAEVPHVVLRWSQVVEMRCEGMGIEDNQGFDMATIEIWGPTETGIVRLDATAPDGSVERLIVEIGVGLDTRRVWSSVGRFYEAETVFRVTSCVQGNSSFAGAQPLVSPFGASLLYGFVELPPGWPATSAFDPADPSVVTNRGEWRGVPVTAIARSMELVDEFGTHIGLDEWWFDDEAGRAERLIHRSDDSVLGSIESIVEVVDRGLVPQDEVSFSTDDLALTLDFTQPADDGEMVTTTLPVEPRGEIDRTRSAEAETSFDECVGNAGWQLSDLEVLVDSEGLLIRASWSVASRDGQPDVVGAQVVEDCLAEAGITRPA